MDINQYKVGQLMTATWMKMNNKTVYFYEPVFDLRYDKRHNILHMSNAIKGKFSINLKNADIVTLFDKIIIKKDNIKLIIEK